MCSMCHYCGADLNDSQAKQDSRKLGNENKLKLNNGAPNWCCKLCQEKLGRQPPKLEGAIPYTTPIISPTTSLSISDRSFSSCSDFSVDMTSCDRGDPEECTSVCNQESPSRLNKGQLSNSMSADSVNRVDRPNAAEERNLRDTKSLNDINVLRDVEITQTSSDEDCKEHDTGRISLSNDDAGISDSVDSDKDTQVWEPPEPEDPEADLEGTIRYGDDDEDDECGDGTNWGRPCSLSNFRDDGRGSYKFKEERQRAMVEVTNGKFKAIVSQFLRSLGVPTSSKDGKNWADIVTYLSWEAASFLKIDAVDGKAAGPDACVKVKCIATGVRGQSQLIKGLVFKKHAAHKHMPTKYKNPRLLLIEGALGQSSSGLSSFHSMEQEKDNMKSLMEVIEMCHPNVILVEKSVSRDVQESILDKGITLVFDMKRHRLERVARCTGSPIISSDTLISTKQKQSDLSKQCDSFYIEKFVEEHAGPGEGGKRPSKTLMFLEGCPMRLGCTILLKGSHSEELKRIKYAVQCSVVMAYHLILETCFLVDQKAMFSTILFAGATDVFPNGQLSEPLAASILATPVDGTISEAVSSTEVSVDGFDKESSLLNGETVGAIANEGSDISSEFSFEPYNPAVFAGFSSLSDSLRKVIGNNFSFGSPAHCQSFSTYLGLNRGETNDQRSNTFPRVESSIEQDPHDRESKSSEGEKPLVDGQPLSSSSEVPCHMEIDYEREDETQSKDEINGVLESQSILVLMSSRNALRGTICEQSHFSHIMFYRNYDVPLGKFLCDNLLNQKMKCSVCGELPEAHFYYYAHHTKQLTIQVKRIPHGKCLPGEADGKLWMWSCCGKCKAEKKSKSSKRVLISTVARGLSFGKFLELSFSEYSSSSRSASCGHSLGKDFIYFFGLGPMVAMFRYSFVTTYEVSLPPQMLEFSGSIRSNWLKEEVENVYMRGMLLFREVSNSLAQIRSRFLCSSLNLLGALKDFSDVEEMLQNETTDFEVNIQNAISKNGQVCYKLLCLNRIRWDLLLESYVWDRRFHSLVLPDPTVVIAGIAKNAGMNSVVGGPSEGLPGSGEKTANGDGNVEVQKGTSSEENHIMVKADPVENSLEESERCHDLYNTSVSGIEKPSNCGGSQNSSSYQALTEEDNHLSATLSGNSYTSSKIEDSTLLDHMHDRMIPILSDSDHDSSVAGTGAPSEDGSQHSPFSGVEGKDGWFWMPFSEIRHRCMSDLQRSHLPKFDYVSKFTQEHLPAGCQLISEEGSRLHIPIAIGTDNSIVSDYEGELSSIIACALALLKDQTIPMDSSDDGSRRERVIESPHGMIRVPTLTSHWSFSGSSDLDSAHSFLSSSSGESRLSSFDGLNLLDVLFSSDACNIEVSLGAVKSLGKSKYTVICLYANQFRELRSLCCPSELDYIASLSRCKAWDAKGGKSKCIFAKTVDDRFIIKEIKKTECESFVKFAPDYFKHMKQSFELGNQTCLAKVLGIYQVIERVPKSGKELRHDLMVMENLSFGRSITRQYDLKGALHARFNTAVDGVDDVLLDQNFVNDMNSSPLYVSNKAKRHLQRAVWNDTRFLNSINVMDYSLLVGVDTQRRELVCGIIDYLRQYTWDKQLETWVKSSLVVPKNVLPTVISPKEYKKRFRKFMSTHFLSVPDHWCSEGFSDPCELCHSGSVIDDFSQPKSRNQEHRSGSH